MLLGNPAPDSSPFGAAGHRFSSFGFGRFAFGALAAAVSVVWALGLFAAAVSGVLGLGALAASVSVVFGRVCGVGFVLAGKSDVTLAVTVQGRHM